MPKGIFERKRKPIEQRFWAKVKKDCENDCWEWEASCNIHGYGQFRIDAKMVLAHRFSYELHYEKIPENMCILHSCDNTRCCNPVHLSIGTHNDNMQDMLSKNRKATTKGSLNGKSKLNEDQVLVIKNKLNLGERNIDIAKEYDVCVDAISKIKTGKTWAHIKIN